MPSPQSKHLEALFSSELRVKVLASIEARANRCGLTRLCSGGRGAGVGGTYVALRVVVVILVCHDGDYCYRYEPL